MTAVLTVWWGDQTVGALRIDRQGDIEFAYAESWRTASHARAISVSLPLRADPYLRRDTRPFFEGLLPEESQRIAVARALGVSQQNEFRLLEQIGGEVAGALSLWPEGETPPAASYDTPPTPLSEDALIALLDRLPTRPLLAGEEGLRLSLAGAQAKVPLILTGAGLALPRPGEPTTHILKPPIARFADTTENEAFAMRLAKGIGLDTADVDIVTVRDRSFLLVKRYDRQTDSEGRVQRLHQEDFCQAMGYTSAQKYAADGGPVFRDCFALLRRAATRPARDVLKLLDAALFNLIIGNADAHGKNFSLLYESDEITLAPLYDLLSTVSYPDLSPNLAMKIARRARLEDLVTREWARFAEETGLTEPFIRRRAALADAVIGRAPAERADFAPAVQPAMQQFADLVAARAARLKDAL
ncbi:MAG: type II toxin-antitoxin system HipA family toxin [Hyphomonadaceae bacterium]|nr:type II toxin-antitoxin system HipA family toxin [Hyphomonadaceae bacterium]